jgi:hypothetical protein
MLLFKFETPFATLSHYGRSSFDAPTAPVHRILRLDNRKSGLSYKCPTRTYYNESPHYDILLPTGSRRGVVNMEQTAASNDSYDDKFALNHGYRYTSRV